MTRLVHPAHLDALPGEARHEIGVWGVFACRTLVGEAGSGRARWLLPVSARSDEADETSTESADAPVEAVA